MNGGKRGSERRRVNAGKNRRKCLPLRQQHSYIFIAVKRWTHRCRPHVVSRPRGWQFEWNRLFLFVATGCRADTLCIRYRISMLLLTGPPNLRNDAMQIDSLPITEIRYVITPARANEVGCCVCTFYPFTSFKIKYITYVFYINWHILAFSLGNSHF